MPPYVIFKGNNFKQEFRDGMPPGTVVSMSKSRHITVEIFNDFIKHFVSHKPQGNKPNILFLDGHCTHESDPDTLQHALDNNVIMISIPPHTSHYIQALDKSFFRSLKIYYYYSTCNSRIKQNPARGIT
jgi:prepilin-type processing-associated H-X9-DG protein